MNRRSIVLALSLACGACTKVAPPIVVHPTCATIDVIHGDVAVTAVSGRIVRPAVSERVECNGAVATDSNGRALVRTDDGLEVRLAADTQIHFADGHPQLVAGRAFVRAWGDDERALKVGNDLTLSVGDGALEAERDAHDQVRVIAVRGEFAWRLPASQGRLEQGESLEGHGALAVRAASVWDDWTGGVASPQGAAQRGAYGSGSAVIHGDPGEIPTPLTVNEQRVNVRVDGDFAFTTVSQRFFNGSDRNAPAEYRVRIPDGAIVAGFTVEHGAATQSGVPATVASSSDVGRAALLADPDGGLFARLDYVAPGDTIRCEIRYAEWLTHRDGVRTYVYPVGDPVDPPFVGEFMFDLNASRASVQAVRAPAGSRIDANQVHIARSDFRPRSDLEVDLFDAHPRETPNARLWRAPADRDGTEHVLLDATLPPPARTPSDLVVLIDDSAATETGTLGIATAALDAMLHAASPSDRVAVMFGDLHARPAAGSAGELAPVTPDRREAMLDAVAHARTGGGTDLAAMLAEAYARLDPRRNGSVLYIGDGMPTTGALDPTALVEETARVAPELRLYVIALGSDPHPEVLAPLTARGGLSILVDDASEAVAAAHRIAAHSSRSVYRDVTFDLGPNVSRPLPERFDPWVAGEPMRVVGELTGVSPTEVRISARGPSGALEWRIPLVEDAVNDGGDIRRRWATARLEALTTRGAGDGALADLGVRYGLITRTSALVLGAPVATNGDDGFVGFDVARSLWPVAEYGTELPHLGVENAIGPRGIHALESVEPFPMVTDEEAGWVPHGIGEYPWMTGLLGYALAAAEPAARACVDRARSVRPALEGDVTVSAVVAADGRVTTAAVVTSSLPDLGAQSCIRRAVAGTSVPTPASLGEVPGTVQFTFHFPAAWVSPHGRGCPATARLGRDPRRTLWTERLASNRGQYAQVWHDASWRCELRVWEDRAALIALMVRTAGDPSELTDLRAVLEKQSVDYLDRAVARRWGATRLWRAYAGARQTLDWDRLVRRLSDPAVTPAAKIQFAEAYRVIAPWDIDLRLRLMSLYEQAGRTHDARTVGDELRHDPYADTRVRALVGEMLIRTGDRDEGQRALTEIVEFAPYDTRARERLGDLLLTYGGSAWAQEAYLQYQTLAALRPDDSMPRVRMALAAALTGREDESLRLLRAVAEDAGTETATSGVEALLAVEIARLRSAHPDERGTQPWVRIARLLRITHDGGVIVAWNHPDVTMDLRTLEPGDSTFQTVSDAESGLNVRVFDPGTALDGSRILLRATSGLAGARTVTAHVSLLRDDDRGPRVVERDVTLTASQRVAALSVHGGALSDDPTPIPPDEQPVPTSDLY